MPTTLAFMHSPSAIEIVFYMVVGAALAALIKRNMAAWSSHTGADGHEREGVTVIARASERPIEYVEIVSTVEALPTGSKDLARR